MIPDFSGVVISVVDGPNIEGGRTEVGGGCGMTVAVLGSSKDSFGKFGDADDLFNCETLFNATAAAIAAKAGLALAASANAGFVLAAKANAGFDAIN